MNRKTRLTLLAGSTILLAMLPNTGRAQNCDCIYPLPSQYMCDYGICKHTITLYFCGGENKNCSYCNDCGQLRLCCQEEDCSAMSQPSCSNPPGPTALTANLRDTFSPEASGCLVAPKRHANSSGITPAHRGGQAPKPAPSPTRAPMCRWNRVPLPLIVTLFTASAVAQLRTPKLALKMQKSVPISGVSYASQELPLRCDADGNIYFRLLERGHPRGGPVIKVSDDGKVEATFALQNAGNSSVRKGQILDFAVGPGGGVALLAFVRERDEQESRHPTYIRYIVQFDADGGAGQEVKVDPRVDPFRIAVFPDGQFLASGVIADTDPGKGESFSPRVGVLDAYGRLAQEVRLPNDVKVGQLTGAQSGTPDFGPVALGTIEMGDDGLAYLWRPAPDPAVYAISSAGQVLRALRLDGPGKGFEPSEMHERSGELVVAYYKTASAGSGASDQDVFVTYNASTGEVINEYEEPQKSGALGCWSVNRFSFLRGDNGIMYIIEAAPSE